MSLEPTLAAKSAAVRQSVDAIAFAIAQSEISRMQAGVLSDAPEAVAKAARLRRGAGRDTSAIPDLWGLIDLHELLSEDAAVQVRDRERVELAVYATATLWALHQQSQRLPMHEHGTGLGAAVRKLMPPGQIDDPLRKRLVRAGSASGFPQLNARLREIVQLLRREKIALDYAVLASQLYRWQVPGGADRVRREWGRSFQNSRPQQPVGTGSDKTGSSQEGSR